MYNTIFWIIIAILVIDFLIENFLDYLNVKKMGSRLTKALEGIYDQEEYAKQQAYQRENHRFGIFSGTFSFLITLAMFVLFGFAFVDSVAWSVTSHAILAALLFFGIIMFASDILGITFSLYDTFVIEEKFGFNKTTPKIFVADLMKGWLMAAIIGG